MGNIKKRPAILLFFVSILMCAGAQASGITQENLKISAADEQQILREAGITRVGSSYKASGCDDHLKVEMLLVDLNGDKQPEVILRVTGSPCFSGMMQSNIGIYVRSSGGSWRDTLGFLPAFSVRVQEAKTKGFADIVLTVLGGCDPLYRWTGGSYYYADQVPAYEGAKCNRR